MNKIKVCALIEKDSKFLIIKRSKFDNDYPNVWDMPSGDLESGESLKDALMREVREETGLNIKITHFSSIWEEKYNSEHLIGIVFLCQSLTSNIKLSKEQEEFKWIHKTEINKFKFAYGVKESLLKSNLIL